jgi:hypothetical protein
MCVCTPLPFRPGPEIIYDQAQPPAPPLARSTDEKQPKEPLMPVKSKYVFVVSMDVDKDKEALFNEVYDTEHVPLLSKVPGVLGVTRIKGQAFAFNLAGERVNKEHEGATYTAIYEIESPAVLLSPEWSKAGEQGRWPKDVRPFTKNRSHKVYQVI